MRCISEKPDVFVDRNENPMDILGIGANMVKSLRYWLQAVGITSEPSSGKRLQSFTELGKRIFANDRYIEELGTLYLLQYELASNEQEATAWYFFFNEFSMSEFTKEDFIDSLQKYIKMKDNGGSYALRSLEDDFNCIINTYLPRYKSASEKISPENNIDCPLGELGLIDVMNRRKKTYRKSITPADAVNSWAALAVIIDNAKGRKEIGLNTLLTAPKNIGRVFNLDSIAMLDVLYGIEKLGKIKISRTAGLDVINILEDTSFIECVDRYYDEIRQ